MTVDPRVLHRLRQELESPKLTFQVIRRNGPVASLKGTPAFGVCGATKAALRSFVWTWTSDLKDRHIRSNVVSPGPTDTPGTRTHWMAFEEQQEIG